ncbi:MAG: choice-of-anchor B family protein, partial [Bacteroidota bacterium]
MRRLVSLFSFLLLVSLTPDADAQRANCSGGLVTPPGSSTAHACDGVDVLGRVSLGEMGSQYASDIWGWTDPDTGKEYALVALVEGTAFVDVSSPEAPKYLGRLPTHAPASVWRDIKVYQNHAFIVADFSDTHGMQVFDLTLLRGVTQPTTFAETAHYDAIGGAHNIAINEDTGFAYIVGDRSACAGGLHMVDIQTPTEPTFAGCFSDDGYTHDVQCVTYDGPDTDYTGSEVCFALNEDTVTIVDVTDKANPVQLSQIIYPNFDYVHQGWLTEDSRYLISNDEGDESTFGLNTRTLVSDVSDLDDPEFLDAYDHGTRAVDHNLYVSGRYVYASNYAAGLRILDTQAIEGDGPQVLEEIAFFDTNPDSEGTTFSGTWSNYPFFESGVVVVSDTQRGLFVLDPQFDGSVAAEDGTTAAASRLQAAFPNPASGRTTLTLTLDQAQEVSVVVYDALGSRVATLFEGALGAEAARSLVFDGSGRPAGLYVVRAVGETFSETQRIV